MPANLQGLNLVHPPTNPHSPLSDAQDLLAAPSYPDLSAQLDLWTHLSFESDEPPARRADHEKHLKRKKQAEDEEDYLPREGTAAHDSHENVVTGTDVGAGSSGSGNAPQGQMPNFDLNHLLAGFGIDPFAAAQGGGMPSLAQLLSAHGAASFPSLPPAAGTSQSQSQSQSQQDAPAAKRPRSRKTSVSAREPSEAPSYSPGAFDDSDPNTTTPVTASEDKRRRNTAASARFRMKKKEREAALEGKAKELEGRVSELERECEGLRRENGWLKGLVVGVTGAAPASMGGHGNGGGKKRSRDDADGGAVAH